MQHLKEKWESPDWLKVGHSLQYEAIWLSHLYGWQLKGPCFDTMIAAHLLDENSDDRSLDALAMKHCGAAAWKDQWKTYEKELKLLDTMPDSYLHPLTIYNEQDIVWTKSLFECFAPKLEKHGLTNLMRVEMENLKTLARMTEWGIQIDQRLLLEWTTRYRIRHEELRNSFDFNPASVPQKLAALRAAGYNVTSTADEVLADLGGKLPARLREFSKINTIRSKYLDGFRENIYADGRIHPQFHQNRTVSGRLSSSAPNGQNFPRDTSDLSFRSLFQGTWGRLLRLDFSQIELRVAAYLSRDKELMRVYRAGEDIHSVTGERIWSKPASRHSENERVAAKVTNFTALYDPFDSAYGSIKYKLHSENGIDFDWLTVKRFVDTFRDTYRGWFDYLLHVTQQVYDQGWVRQPITGRIRRSPGTLRSWGLQQRPESLQHLRELCQGNNPLQEIIRSIANSLDQGFASGDLTKLVGTAIDRKLRRLEFRSQLCNTVHDEILIDVHPEEEREVIQIAYQISTNPPLMQAFGKGFDIPIGVEMGIGENWSEAKKKENKIDFNL